MNKWTEKEPKNKSLIICYYKGGSMLYWIDSEGYLCDAHTGLINIGRKHRIVFDTVKAGYWKYANYG